MATRNPAVDARRLEYQDLKSRIHQLLLNRLNLERLTQLARVEAEPQIREVINALMDREARTPLTMMERESLVTDVLNELFGLGPLEALLHDPTVSDILVNRFDQVWVERHGQLQPTAVVFKDEAHLRRIIERIVTAAGRRIDEASPIVDARLADGSRVNAIIPPLAVDGPALSIRRFPSDRITPAQLVAGESLTDPMLQFLRSAVMARLNIVISGGTGAGKTTLLDVLGGFISAEERIITIEDAAELRLQQRHIVRLETRPPNIEGKGCIRQRQLVINALRMRPDRIIVGEVRGEEALDMLQAMNTGHDGSLTTIHANSPRDAIYRLETMVAMANLNIPEKAARQQIASAVQIIVQVTRLSDGRRKVTQIAEVGGLDGENVVLEDLFVFRKGGVDAKGRVIGRFHASGVRPRSTDRFTASGVPLPAVAVA